MNKLIKEGRKIGRKEGRKQRMGTLQKGGREEKWTHKQENRERGKQIYRYRYTYYLAYRTSISYIQTNNHTYIYTDKNKDKQTAR